MKLYLDDDSVNHILIKLLRADAHDVELPADTGLAGASDPSHLRHAVRAGRVFLSHNHDDFQSLHDLVIDCGGHHSGILMVRRDNDASRDLTPRGIVLAIRNLTASGIELRDQFQILNQWR